MTSEYQKALQELRQRLRDGHLEIQDYEECFFNLRRDQNLSNDRSNSTNSNTVVMVSDFY